jgi:hypothetical protein
LQPTAARLQGPDINYNTALRLCAGCWRDLRYHGDWMLRPIASNEVAFLVRLLVGISRAVNSRLGLTGVPIPPGEEPPETVTQVRCTAASACQAVDGTLLFISLPVCSCGNPQEALP